VRKGILAGTSAALTEVTRHRVYEGSPLYGKGLAWMGSQGFRTEIDPVPSRYGNVLFVR
jgi:hypothetical protein